MKNELLEQLLEKSKDGVKCGRSILQIIEMEMKNSKTDVQPEDWVKLESAFEQAKDIVESIQLSLLQNEKNISLTPRISDEELQNLRMNVSRNRMILENKKHELERLNSEMRLKYETHIQAFEEELKTLMDPIRNQEELITALHSKLLKLDADSPEEDEFQRDFLIPRVVFDPVETEAVPSDLELGAQRSLLKVPMSCEGVSRESGISDGYSPGYQSLTDGSYR